VAHIDDDANGDGCGWWSGKRNAGRGLVEEQRGEAEPGEENVAVEFQKCGWGVVRDHGDCMARRKRRHWGGECGRGVEWRRR
jgi:hypothetical protein